MNIGEIYEQLDSLYGSNQGKDIEEFLLSKIAEAVNISDSNTLIQLLNELIRFYRETGEHEKCITYFNNMSLIFQEMGDYESACDCLERALGISLNYPECHTEQAITYSNLANTFVKLDRVDDAKDCLEKAIQLFQMDDNPDYHFSAALSSLAEICYSQKDYADAIKYYEQVLYQIENSVGKNKAYEIVLSNIHVIKDELIEKIVKLEWEAFDKVINEGGRAFCQDDWETFSIMRRSQYLLWDAEMLESIISDFSEANKLGWNIIAEKYGRMEETTAPIQYEKIKDSLPYISDEKRNIIEAIVGIQVGMMEEFAKDYPKSAMQARSIHTSDDSKFNTSYETYLRGEISTYSDNTLALYGRFVARIANEGKNIARMTMENTAIMYGYESIDILESKLY